MNLDERNHNIIYLDEFFEDYINNNKKLIIKDSGPLNNITELKLKRFDNKIYLETISNVKTQTRYTENLILGKISKNKDRILLSDANDIIEIEINPIKFCEYTTLSSVNYIEFKKNSNNKEIQLIEYIKNMDTQISSKRIEYINSKIYCSIQINISSNLNISLYHYNKNCQYIHYKSILSEKNRMQIRDCISFILGKPIIYLGYSTYTYEKELVNWKFIKANKFIGSNNLYNMNELEILYLNENGFSDFQIEKSSYPPTKDFFSNEYIIEEKFNEIFMSIYKIYEQYNLNKILWDYWFAESSPYHSAVVQYGACLEQLQNKYFSLNIEYFMTKIKDKKNLLKKSHLSQKEKFEIFFDSLGIEFNELEKETWKYRNYSAHGNKFNDINNNIKFIKSKSLLKTLFNRVILKLANLDVNYVDYYSESTNKYRTRDINKGIK